MSPWDHRRRPKGFRAGAPESRSARRWREVSCNHGSRDVGAKLFASHINLPILFVDFYGTSSGPSCRRPCRACREPVDRTVLLKVRRKNWMGSAPFRAIPPPRIQAPGRGAGRATGQGGSSLRSHSKSAPIFPLNNLFPTHNRRNYR